jgi:hypothetical protein
MSSVLDTKSKYGVTVAFHDFGQAQFEQYQEAAVRAARDAFYLFSGSDGAGVTATAKVRGETVRAALRTGILSGLTLEEVGGLKPYVVEWIADLLRAHVTHVTTAPPDPN